MTNKELREAWTEIREKVDAARERYKDDLAHELNAWGFGDATEHQAAMDYIEAVLNAEK